MDTETESSSEAEQEFVSFLLADNLSSAKELEHQVSKRSTLKKKYVERPSLESSNTGDAANHAAEQLSKCKLDPPEEEHAIPSNSQVALSDISPETRKKTEGWENNSSSSVVFLGVSKTGAEQFKRLLARSKQPIRCRLKGPADSVATKSNLLEGLQQTFTEWRTEETLKLLHSFSSEATQEPPASTKGDELDEDDFDSTDDPNDAISERGLEPCLDLSLPVSESKIAAAKPLPSFEKLREDTALMELKVKEFYEGKVTLVEEGLMRQPGGDQQHNNDKVIILTLNGLIAKPSQPKGVFSHQIMK